MSELTAERLRDLLDYDPETGIFRCRRGRGRTPAGAIAGSPYGKGYLGIKIDYRLYYNHRLAWLYMTGEWPKDQVDHKNRIRDDNRWENLREATNGQNTVNSVRSKASGLPRGVYLRRRKRPYKAQIVKDGKWHNLGAYSTVDEASQAYQVAAAKFHGEFFQAGGAL